MPGTTTLERRLAANIFLTSGVALALACVVFVVFDAVSMRRTLERDAETLAAVIGLNTADALRFQDPAAAELVLGSLRAAPEALGAAVYDARGRRFASYAAGSGAPARFDAPAAARPDRATASWQLLRGHLDVYHPLALDDERLGVVLVRFDTGALSRRAQAYVAIVAVLLALVFGVSRWIAGALRDRVAEPLGALARGAAAVAEGRLATRAAVEGDAEIRALAAAFNDMGAGLGELVARVRENAGAVGEMAEALSAESERMSSDVLLQEQGVEEASRSMGGVADSLREVSANVEQLAALSRDTSSSILEMDTSTGEVASHMDRLAESLEEASSGTSQMATSVREIGRAMEGLERSTLETATRLEQMAESVRRMERNALESAELSREASAEADRGLRAVEESGAAMEAIRTGFERIQGSVGGLAEKSGAIGEILGVIENVVDQTNMLALNAAIIAARAGDHGRGFSVVADEIKTLADRTARSTREIAALIASVQAETEHAVGAVEDGARTVDTGVERATEAGAVLRAIRDRSQSTSERVNQIVKSAGRQSIDIRGVEEAMATVRRLAEQTSRSTHESERVGSEIAGSVEQIRELGLEVKRSTAEQRRQSGLMTRAIEDVATGVDQILQATTSQTRESTKIRHALDVFREVAEGGARRAEVFHRMVEDLSHRSERLRETIGRFAS